MLGGWSLDRSFEQKATGAVSSSGHAEDTGRRPQTPRFRGLTTATTTATTITGTSSTSTSLERVPPAAAHLSPTTPARTTPAPATPAPVRCYTIPPLAMHIAHGLSPFREDEALAVFREEDDDDLDSSSAGGSTAWRLPDFADDYYTDQGIAAHTPTSLPATRHAPPAHAPTSLPATRHAPPAHAPMLDMDSLAFGEHGFDSKHPAALPPRYACPTPPLSELASRMQNRTPTPTLTPTAKQRSCRNFWSVDGDRALLRAMLHHEHLLAVARKSRPRSRYWQTISETLAARFGMHRNKRQCRDRFNLIYWKAVRDSHQDLSADSELAGLMRECMRRFYIDKDNNLMLRPQAPSPATPATHTGAPAGANAVAAAMPASPVSKPQLELLAQLQNQVLQLTNRMDDLHRALDAHRALVHQLEQSPDAWPHADEPSVGVAAHGYQERCAGRIFGLNDQIW